MRRKMLIAFVVAFAMALGVLPTAATADHTNTAEDPFHLVHSAVLKRGKVVERSTGRLDREAFSDEQIPAKRGKPVVEPQRDKLHPRLSRLLGRLPAERPVHVIVTYRDDLRIPRFPEPVADEPRTSEANQLALREAAALVADIKSERSGAYERIGAELGEVGAKVLETYWLVKAVRAQVPAGAVEELAARDDVVYVELRATRNRPPNDGIPDNDVDDGRARITSDPYFNLGQTTGFIGLLDTGIRATHTQFAAPSNIDFRRDCVNGVANNCTTGAALNPNDDCWNHGTSSAGIISANGNQGNKFRGVTDITLDSFKVYPTTRNASGGCVGFLDTNAVLRAFQAAVAVLDRVIVAEMQAGGNDVSSISSAADNAFDAGAVIIAANGNNGPNASTVNAPANAHRVLGVGNFDVRSLTQVNGQSRGPAPDNRIKPDIQAPTNTETASAASNTATRAFGGTSGATPYAAGAAALLRNWLRGNTGSIDPGQVYAQMILSGQRAYPFTNTSGAGPLSLPVNGHAWWGKTAVGNGGTINIPIHVGANRTELDGALWWPEGAWLHSDVDLSLIDPNGVVRDSSLSIPSVFERARVSGPLQQGTWTLRIRGYSVPWFLNQTVYWAAHVR